MPGPQASAAADPALEVPRAPDGLARILLRLPNWIGDVVMAAPAVAAIHAARPQATLVAQVRPSLRGLAALLPGVGAVLDAGRDGGPRALWRSRRRLRAERFDACVVFPRGARAALAPWLAGIPVRVGLAGRGPLLTHPVGPWRGLRRAHRSAFYGVLARPFGPPPAAPWALAAPPALREGAERLLRALGRRGTGPLVVLEAGAAYGPAKCWPPERYGALARRLIEQGAEVAVVGAPPARPVEAAIARVAGPRLLRGVGRTPDLAALVGVLAVADAVVSNDTGPMHVAAALGTPLVALFGATDPVVSGPMGPGPRRMVHDPEPCSPCFLRTCPIPGHPCLEKIAVETVETEVRALLDASRGGPASSADAPPPV